jgi:WD40 repeat protein
MMLQGEDRYSSRPSAAAFTYDLFVIHAAADEWFVQGYLLAKLSLAPHRVLLPRTLELGQSIISEIERGVRSSRTTIVVLSYAYVADHWAVLGERIAQYASLARDHHAVLLPLLREDCELPAHIRMQVALDFRDPGRDAWGDEIERLRAHLEPAAYRDLDLPCPYPGMRPFTQRDAPQFFGRDDELDDLVDRLRRGDRVVFVIGASGSGKSSLIAAGLVPRLDRGVADLPRCCVRALRPGEDPMAQLADALGGDPAAPGAAVDALLARHAPASTLLLIVDQLEELFAIAGDGERAAFIAAIRALRADPRCALLFVLRSDFYGALIESPLWTEVEGPWSRIELGSLRGDRLRTVIERPARDRGVYVQPELVSRLVADSAREPGALPLLQETLCRLWRKRRQRLLALDDYQSLGDGTRTGLAFAISEHADEVLSALAGHREAIALRILLRLVAFGEGRADTRRQQPLADLRSDGESPDDFEAVLRHLIDHRLVTAGGDRSGPVRVDLGHEILIQAWPMLVDWIRAWRGPEQRRRELEAAAAAWRARGSGEGGLLDAGELAGAAAWRSRAVVPLGHSSELAAFFAASHAAFARLVDQRRRRTWGAFAAVALFALITSTLAVVARSEAEEADRHRREAVAQRDQRNQQVAKSVPLYQELGRQRLLEAERPLEALPYLIEARTNVEATGEAPSEALRMLFAQATRNLPVSPLRHRDIVLAAAFSRDGARVVTAGADATARVWDAASGQPLSPPLRHRDIVWTAAFSPDGTRVVTASNDGTARIWDAASGAPLSPPLEHPDGVLHAGFSAGGTRVVTASWDAARVWDLSGEPVSPPFRHRGHILSAGFGGRALVVTAGDDAARVWDVASGRPVSPLLPHAAVARATLSPDGARVVTASDDAVRVWEVAHGAPLSPPLSHPDGVNAVAFSPDGGRIASAGGVVALVWDATSGAPLSPPLEHRGAIYGVAFSSDGTRVVTASWDDTVRVWDAASGTPELAPFQHPRGAWSAAFSPDGSRVVSVSDDSALIWDAAPRARALQMFDYSDHVVSAAFGRDGARIVTAGIDHTARVWDASGRPLTPPLLHRSHVLSAAFSPDGARVVTACADNSAQLWDLASGAARTPPLLHRDGVASAAFSPDGARVVTASWDHTARIWDAASGQPLSPPMEHRGRVVSAAFSPDGSRVVTAAWDLTARIWDAGSGRPLSPPLEHRASVMSAAFSPDGRRVVTASGDLTARVWDSASGLPVSPPLQHRAGVVSAAFSRDGSRIVTTSQDHTVRIWDAASGQPLAPPLQLGVLARSAVFDGDGARILVAAGRTAWIWQSPLAPGSLAQWRAIGGRAAPR